MQEKTPVRNYNNIIIKIEAFNHAGSHKSRAARFMIDDALKKGSLVSGGQVRILEKSGGNLGVGLAYEAAKFNVKVDLVVGLSFSPLKRRLCEKFGAKLVGLELLEAGKLQWEVIDILLKEQPDLYFYTNQFANKANLKAHTWETGLEFLNQLHKFNISPDKEIILVLGAGTGASFQGVINNFEPYFKNLKKILIMPKGNDYNQEIYTDHKIEGIAVAARPSFLDLNLIDNIINVSDKEAQVGQQLMASDIGLFPGMSSGANYFVAKQFSQSYPNAVIATIAYDAGEAYLNA